MSCKKLSDLVNLYGPNWQSHFSVNGGPYISYQACVNAGVCCPDGQEKYWFQNILYTFGSSNCGVSVVSWGPYADANDCNSDPKPNLCSTVTPQGGCYEVCSSGTVNTLGRIPIVVGSGICVTRTYDNGKVDKYWISDTRCKSYSSGLGRTLSDCSEQNLGCGQYFPAEINPETGQPDIDPFTGLPFSGYTVTCAITNSAGCVGLPYSCNSSNPVSCSQDANGIYGNFESCIFGCRDQESLFCKAKGYTVINGQCVKTDSSGLDSPLPDGNVVANYGGTCYWENTLSYPYAGGYDCVQ